MNFTCKFYAPYFLGLLVKKSDNLYMHMKYDLLDTKGYFKDRYRHLDGMFLGNVTLTRIHHERCTKDLEANTQGEYGSTLNREKLYVRKRINL